MATPKQETLEVKLDRLSKQVLELAGQVHGLANRLRLSGVVRAAIGAAMVLSLVASLVAINVTDDIVKTRTEARFTECLRDNRQAADAVSYATDQADILIAASHAALRRPTTANERSDAAAYRAEAIASASKLFPKRACDKESIDEFYKARSTT